MNINKYMRIILLCSLMLALLIPAAGLGSGIGTAVSATGPGGGPGPYVPVGPVGPGPYVPVGPVGPTVPVSPGWSYPGWSSPGWQYLNWQPYQPAVKQRRKTTTRKTETLVSSTPMTGEGCTNITWVNLRATPSVYGNRVRKIHYSGTHVTITAQVTNSSSQLWYAVTMDDGTAGYIRADLINVTQTVAAVQQVTTATPAPPVSEAAPTPTPMIVYITPEPTPAPAAEVTPQVIYVVLPENP